MGVNQTPNHADYRLLSNRALEALKQYKEQNIYLRGLVPLVGYPSIEVQYSREERIAGESKYPIKKCLRWLSRNYLIISYTVTNYSYDRFYNLHYIYHRCDLCFNSKTTGTTVEGWTSVMIAIFFLGGVQMLSLGIIGEYVGKIYIETKNRPKYFIDESVGNDSNGK